MSSSLLPAFAGKALEPRVHPEGCCLAGITLVPPHLTHFLCQCVIAVSENGEVLVQSPRLAGWQHSSTPHSLMTHSQAHLLSNQRPTSNCTEEISSLKSLHSHTKQVLYVCVTFSFSLSPSSLDRVLLCCPEWLQTTGLKQSSCLSLPHWQVYKRVVPHPVFAVSSVHRADDYCHCF